MDRAIEIIEELDREIGMPAVDWPRIAELAAELERIATQEED